MRKKRKTVWAFLDGKKLVDVVQAALDNNMMVDDLKAKLIAENPGHEVVYFDIQVTNEDPTSSVGRQTVILKDCNIDGGILTKFDADAEYLDEDMDFTFEDFEMPEAFTLLAGME